LTDNLGTVRDLAEYDPATQTTSIVNHQVFSAFGQLESQTNLSNPQAAAVDCLFGFTGQLFDTATGLQNNLNRWYDPATGTWLSQDPKGFAAGDANLQRYVGNGATYHTDPMGLQVPGTPGAPTMPTMPTMPTSPTTPTTTATPTMPTMPTPSTSPTSPTTPTTPTAPATNPSPTPQEMAASAIQNAEVEQLLATLKRGTTLLLRIQAVVAYNGGAPPGNIAARTLNAPATIANGDSLYNFGVTAIQAGNEDLASAQQNMAAAPLQGTELQQGLYASATTAANMASSEFGTAAMGNFIQASNSYQSVIDAYGAAPLPWPLLIF
jgi:RHS repeat-associated protein